MPETIYGFTVDRAATAKFILDRLDRGKTPTGTELRTLRSLFTDMQADATETADLTVYELRTGPDNDPRPDVIARYAITLAAMEHGEAQYRAKYGSRDALEWPFTGTDDVPVWRLEAVDEWDGIEVSTDWHIVAVTIPAEYKPEAGA